MAPADDLTVVVARYGFRVQRPAQDWISYASPPGAESDTYTLTLYQRDTAFLPSVTIYAAEHSGATSEAARAAAVVTVEKRGDIILEQGDSTLAGRPAARLVCRATSQDGRGYDSELLYLAAPPFVYALQCNWATGSERPDALFAPLIESFAVFAPQLPEEDPGAQQVAELAARCGSELEWSADWAAAAARAQAEGKPVCIVFEHYTVLDIPHTIASGALMDGDLVSMLRERFVMLRLGIEDPAPFREPWAWGMGSHSWGGSILFASGRGEVLEELGVPNTFLVADAARRVLARQASGAAGSAGAATAPATAPATPAATPAATSATTATTEKPASSLAHDSAERLDLGERALRRGDLQAARALLDRSESARGHALLASLLRQERRGDEALHELADARRVADPEDPAAAALLQDLTVEEGVVHMRLGQWAEAQELFQRALSDAPGGARAAEARFWLGAVVMLQKGYPQGSEHWQALVAEHADSRWAWKAAANLSGIGSFVNAGERLDWPEPAIFEAVSRPAAGKLSVGQVERAQRDAVAYLVGSQLADGSWVAPMDAFSVTPSGYTFAVTGLCGASLLPFAGTDTLAKAAVIRAETYLLAVHAAGGFHAGSDLAGVYSIWGRVYALRFLAQCRAAHIGGDARLQTALDELLQSVLDGQHDGGGWPYIMLQGDGGTGFDPSASFLTAGVVLALLDVRAAGTAVPQEALDGALRFLASLRHADGGFRYMRDAPEAEDNPEAAGRGPVCALALLRGGAGDVEALAVSMKRFDEQRAALKHEWGKDTCHTGPEGQGAHYLLFDWAFAAEAVGELPHSRQATYRRALLQDLLDVRDAQGAYADMPSLGRAYGTAMALAAFGSLAEER